LTENVSVIRTEVVVNKLNYIVKLQRSLSDLNGKGNEEFTISLNQHLYAGQMDTIASHRLLFHSTGNDTLVLLLTTCFPHTKIIRNTHFKDFQRYLCLLLFHPAR